VRVAGARLEERVGRKTMVPSVDFDGETGDVTFRMTGCTFSGLAGGEEGFANSR
jgi:hypothetical protein